MRKMGVRVLKRAEGIWVGLSVGVMVGKRLVCMWPSMISARREQVACSPERKVLP